MAYISPLKAPEERLMVLYMMNYMPGGACKSILDFIEPLSDWLILLHKSAKPVRQAQRRDQIRLG